MKTNTLLSFLALGLLATACIPDRADVQVQYYTPDELRTLQARLNLPAQVDEYSFNFIEISNAKATLGRVLFYDKQLSRNNSVSCASCHKQDAAFSDTRAKSVGFNGQETKRNSIPLAASANFVTSYGGGNSFTFVNTNGPAGRPLTLGFLWDERAHSITEQSALAITDPVEMGMSMADLALKLSAEPHYRILFRKAYGDERIIPDRITEALQEFLNGIVSVNSKFDRNLQIHGRATDVNFSGFTAVENIGKSLYMTHCSGCHGRDMSAPVMRVANNGLDVVSEDKGVGGITNKASDMGLFKVPFLRNIALTAPYMHDGRFNTLEEVIEHYNSGIQMHPNLHQLLRNPMQPDTPKRLNLSATDKAALIAFLHTLTDDSTIRHSRFSDPFK